MKKTTTGLAKNAKKVLIKSLQRKYTKYSFWDLVLDIIIILFSSSIGAIGAIIIIVRLVLYSKKNSKIRKLIYERCKKLNTKEITQKDLAGKLIKEEELKKTNVKDVFVVLLSIAILRFIIMLITL